MKRKIKHFVSVESKTKISVSESDIQEKFDQWNVTIEDVDTREDEIVITLIDNRQFETAEEGNKIIGKLETVIEKCMPEVANVDHYQMEGYTR